MQNENFGANRSSRDLRVIKTLDAIHGAFESLLLERPYSKITVVSVCERARINKKTFYRYYQTLDDLLQELLDQYITPYVALTSGMRYPEDVEKVTRIFLKYCAEQGSLFDAIIANEIHESILRCFVEGSETERFAISGPPDGWNDDEWRLYMTTVTSAQLRVYQQWVKDGRVVSLDRMIDIACKVICHGACLGHDQSRR